MAEARPHSTPPDPELMTTILNALPDPVLLLGSDRQVSVANAVARELLGEAIEGRGIALGLRHPAALEAIDAILGGGRDTEEVELTLPVPVQRTFNLLVSALPDRDTGALGALLVLHDITAVKAGDQMRADFVANVSHELRSPLSSLAGFIETLRDAARDDEEARERFLKIMEKEANRMTRLIGDLLSLSKVEADEHIRPQGTLQLTNLLREIADSLAVRAKDRDMRISFEADGRVPEVEGDRDELIQVFRNLLDNAISYGAAGTSVTVTIEIVDRIPESGGAGVAVAVANQGDGIAPEHVPRLTERFYRVDKGRSRSMGGTGRGLAIVKHVVNRHRGRLVIDSALGQGSTFTVYLPVTAAAGLRPSGPRRRHETVTDTS